MQDFLGGGKHTVADNRGGFKTHCMIYVLKSLNENNKTGLDEINHILTKIYSSYISYYISIINLIHTL